MLSPWHQIASNRFAMRQDVALSASVMLPARLELTSGEVFHGTSFGYAGCASGEAVFQTGMVGYPQALTDPSYAGQILILTYPSVGNYGVPVTDANASADTPIPDVVESARIHPAALIVSEFSEEYSHWRAKGGLSEWLNVSRVPGITGVDTRALTKLIRQRGSTLARVVIGTQSPPQFSDPNLRNLVEEVSCTTSFVLNGTGGACAPRVVVVDCGLKLNQLRELTKRCSRVTVVPWDTQLQDFDKADICDGIFLSNGPGDPVKAAVTVEELKGAISRRPGRPVFGICLGHQLMALAAGLGTYKLKHGNRGHNQPAVDLTTGRCHITSQNHGYAVQIDPAEKKGGGNGNEWFATFVNANDGTNEGIAHSKLPLFSVQFHPEACAGPTDTNYLFDIFSDAAKQCRQGQLVGPLFDSSKVATTYASLHLGFKKQDRVIPALAELSFPPSDNTTQTKKVIILGSGGLSIGQAGEFDYSGSQAIKALASESIKTVLINPNIATVQTSPGLADKVYFLPVTPESVVKVAEYERPDAILLTFGGQTALNCGVELYKSGHLERLGIKVLGTPIEAILDTEDRERFKDRLKEIGEPFAVSRSCENVQDSLVAANELGYPVILRAAFALGGLGSGFADNDEELVDIATRAFSSSSQVLIERSMKGWKEIEYEVVRDAHDNCITVCNMENFDPLGIHTGDSIVVAPSQTLTDDEYQILRDAALRTVRHLGVVGECNIQYALNPHSMQYCIIEVNARLSRSSALASKATGYPLAFVAAKLALGMRLTDIRNSITKETSACFEPSLDYMVVKMPRWDLRKFPRVRRNLDSSMKSVGEVMAIGRNFEETLQKAVRMSRDNYVNGFESGVVAYSEEEMLNPTDDRLLAIADGLAKGVSVERIHELTKIDKWFLQKLARISEQELALRGKADLSVADLVTSKCLGFSDRQIGKLAKITEIAVRKLRERLGVRPCVKQIDTVAAEFPAKTNFLYVTYANVASYVAGCEFEQNKSERPRANGSPSIGSRSSSLSRQFIAQDHDILFDTHGVIVLGSGAYRIGSSVEFDSCAVSATRTLRKQGASTIMINYNPETVSTDYDECDRLYFEELSFERVLDIYEYERSAGIIVSMGGQLANNIAMALHRQSARILGTTPEMIDGAENRYKFSRMLDRIEVDQPQWKELSSIVDAKSFCVDVGYPVLVRPSYVLSGASMNVVHRPEDLEAYLTEAATVSSDCPVVISKFILEAKEIEVDAVAEKGQLVMHVVSEHVENAGVHSGDATLILPPKDLDDMTVRKVEIATAKVADALNVTGPMNIQFIAKDREIKVIECNLRASRTFPFISKTIGLDMAELAVNVMTGHQVARYPVDVSAIKYVGVKAAQFSFTRLPGADPILGVEMTSTGEVACYGATPEEAYAKALISTSRNLPTKAVALSIGTYKEKMEFLQSAKTLVALGVKLIATPGTAEFFEGHSIQTEIAVGSNKGEYSASEAEHNIAHMLRTGRVDFFINIPSNISYRRLASYESPGYLARRAAVDFGVPLLTNIKCAKLFVKAVEQAARCNGNFPLSSCDAQYSSYMLSMPGLVLLDGYVNGTHSSQIAGQKPTVKRAGWQKLSREALRGGFCIAAAAASVEESETSERLLALAEAGKKHSLCDFAIFATAGRENMTIARHLTATVYGLKVPADAASCFEEGSVEDWILQLEKWPTKMPIFIEASGRSLAALLFAAVLSDRDVHVSQVRTRNDIQLIRSSKQRGLSVSCTVNVLDLYATRNSGRITVNDQEALWENYQTIDAVAGPPEYVLPLLLASVNEGRLSIDWVRSRLCETPRKILGLPESTMKNYIVEVDFDTTWTGPAESDIAGIPCRGRVRRVMIDDKVAFLDGKIWAEAGTRRNLTPDVSVQTEQPRVMKRPSSSSLAKPLGKEKSQLEGKLPIPNSIAQPQTPVGEFSRIVPDVLGQELGTVGLRRYESMWSDSPHQGEITPRHAINSSMYALDRSLSMTTLPGKAVAWAGRDVLSVSEFSRDDLHKLFEVAQEMRAMVSRVGHWDLLKGKILGSLFFEPSTRTSCSFQAAMQRLGGTVLSITDVTQSSVAKGETLRDTIRTLECYTDIIVMRHPAVGAAQEAANSSRHPVVNAGDGVGEHPTQAMLDVFTIREELGTVQGIVITFVGDLKNGRTVHSLARLLTHYAVRIHYVSPESLRMPTETLGVLADQGIYQKEHRELSDEVLRETDVLYVTRVQKERFKSKEEYDAVRGRYVVTPKTLTRAKEDMIVMHPLPRTGEISEDVDSDPRAVYFRQMEHGMYVRMALLALLLGQV